MKLLVRRVWRLESRAGTTTPLPWEMPGWAQRSDAELLGELERYIAAYPDSVLAQTWRVIDTLSDHELTTLLADLEASLGATP